VRARFLPRAELFNGLDLVGPLSGNFSTGVLTGADLTATPIELLFNCGAVDQGDVVIGTVVTPEPTFMMLTGLGFAGVAFRGVSSASPRMPRTTCTSPIAATGASRRTTPI
jgi:hypothetical protein